MSVEARLKVLRGNVLQDTHLASSACLCLLCSQGKRGRKLTWGFVSDWLACWLAVACLQDCVLLPAPIKRHNQPCKHLQLPRHSCSASLKDRRNCRVPWAQFCADPWSATDGLHDRGCIKRSKSYLYFHMTDQYHCMRTAEGNWAVDFIGRVDRANEDWVKVCVWLGIECHHQQQQLGLSCCIQTWPLAADV